MTGFQLKLLAMLAMTADHIGAVFFPEIPLLRWIGRLAMPVLCFFIGEGLRHTRSPRAVSAAPDRVRTAFGAAL